MSRDRRFAHVRSLVGVLAGVLFLSACVTTPTGLTGPCPLAPLITSTSDDDMNWFEETAVIVDDYGQQLVGFDESVAENCVENSGFGWRVVARDGEFFAVTADYSPQRLNAVIENSVVTEMSAG